MEFGDAIPTLFLVEATLYKFIMLVGALCIMAFSKTGMAAEGYEILFKRTASKLSRQEKMDIFNQLGFRLSKERKFIIDDTCEENVSPDVEVTDLNGDGIDEVFIIWGNTCTSGHTGQSITLFIKDRKGRFVKNLDVPGNSYNRLSQRNKGFPNLIIGGPGFCYAVWKWSGIKYEYKCSREDAPRACAQIDVTTVCK
jgi:hypothetical protein